MRAAIVAIALSLSACSAAPSRSSTPPAATGVRAFIDALRADDPERAYAMLSADARDEVTYDEFALMWKQSKAERDHQARALEEGLKGQPDLGEVSKIVYRDGKAVHLRREAGGWKLESALVTGIYAGRPHDAVKVFAEGLAGRDYERVMRVLTNRRREVVRKQVDAFTDSLIRNLEAPIHFIGKSGAELRWEDGDKRYRVVLRKEGDEWRIDDVHITTMPEIDRGEKK